MIHHQERILVIKLGALGDFIQALGPMAAIRAHHPNAHITLLTTKPFEGLAHEAPYFDDIILDDKPKWSDITSWVKLRTMLNTIKAARVYDLQNNDRTAFYFKLCNPRPEWVGVARGASHRNTSPERTKGHAFDGHKQTLALAGIENVHVDPMDWIKADIRKFDLKPPFALLVPGSAPEHPQKRWPAEHFAELAGHLMTEGLQPVLLGTNAEKEVTDKIKSLQPKCINLNGQTSLFEIIALGRKAALCVGNDTGPMHMIGPTGCPTTVLFSKQSNFKKHYPLGPYVSILHKDDLKDLSARDVVENLELAKPRHAGRKSSTLH